MRLLDKVTDKNLILICCFLLTLFIFVSCSNRDIDAFNDKVNEMLDTTEAVTATSIESKNIAEIFLNDGEKLVGKKIELSDYGQINSVLAILKTGVEEENLYKTIPDENTVERVVLENRGVKVYLGESYKKLSETVSLFMRSSLIKSYTSLQSVDFVEFYVDNAPLKDSKGVVCGPYYSDDIVYDNELIKETFYYEKVEVYYPKGDYLEPVLENIELAMNDTIANQVIERLKVYADEENVTAIPANTKYINADITDGVCYLNLSEEFLTYNSGTKEDRLAIYSVVNTITGLPEVNKVQFLIDGEKVDILRAMEHFNEPYEYNYDLVKQ